MRQSEKRTASRKRRASRPRGTGPGGNWGDEFRDRLRLLIQRLAKSNRAFAHRCEIEAPRLSEWLAGEQFPGLKHLRLIADRTGVSLDWLLLGIGGPSPVFTGQSRSQTELEQDIAVYVRREIHRREAEGAFDTPDHGVRLGLESWLVDGAGLLSGLVRDEERRVKEWILWEKKTEALDGLVNDSLGALRKIVPYLPADDKELGYLVYQLGRAAGDARELRTALGMPEEPSAFRGTNSRIVSHPTVGPKAALEICEVELKEEGGGMSPITRRIKAGTARLAPRRDPNYTYERFLKPVIPASSVGPQPNAPATHSTGAEPGAGT